jgi:hypothetical protein
MNYQIDGEDFFKGCCEIEVSPDDYEIIHTTYRCGGYTGLAEESLKAVWVGADERRQEHSDRMKRLWAEGRIKPHQASPELSAQRSAAMKLVWAERRAALQ